MGFTQVEGVDYHDTHASVMATKSFRILLALWNLEPTLSFEHWDIKTAFVNAPLEETVYTHMVKGFERPGSEGKVLLLKKALYGCKQAAAAWQKFLSDIFLSLGATRHPSDECIYVFSKGPAWVVIGTHVDDLFPLYNPAGKKLRDEILEKLEKKMTVDNKG